MLISQADCASEVVMTRRQLRAEMAAYKVGAIVVDQLLNIVWLADVRQPITTR
jgi:hypothetical protein